MDGFRVCSLCWSALWELCVNHWPSNICTVLLLLEKLCEQPSWAQWESGGRDLCSCQSHTLASWGATASGLLLPTCWKSLLISICCNYCSQSCSCTSPAQVSISFSHSCLKGCIELPLVLALHILVVQHILVCVAVMSAIQSWQYLRQTEPQWPVIRHHDILDWMSHGQKSVANPWTHLSTSPREGSATCSSIFAVNNAGWRGDATERLKHSSHIFPKRKFIYQHLFSFVILLACCRIADLVRWFLHF